MWDSEPIFIAIAALEGENFDEDVAAVRDLLERYERLISAAQAYASWEPNEIYEDWPKDMKADREALIKALP